MQPHANARAEVQMQVELQTEGGQVDLAETEVAQTDLLAGDLG